MHETLKFDVTVRFALSEKLALKSRNVLIKNGVALFYRTIDSLLRYGMVWYGTIRYGTPENSDKNGISTVFYNPPILFIHMVNPNASVWYQIDT
jgi:hypothetical protein